MNSRLRVVLALTLFVLHNVGAINILGIFDIPSKSVHILGHELLLGLAKKGHNVTLLSSFPLESKVANYTHIYLDGLLDYKEKNYGEHIQGNSKSGMFGMVNAQIDLVDLGMQNKNLQAFLKSDSKYDVIIHTYAMNEGYLGLAHHFDARVIGFVPFSSFPHITALTGNSAPYSYVSIPFVGFTQEMTFFQRTINTIAGTIMTLLHKFYMLPKQNKILKTHFPNAPSVEEIQRERVDLVFINVHFSSELPRPNTPNIVYIGGYHVQEPEPLEPEIKKFLDGAKEGVIFLSLGSNVESNKLPKDKLDAIINKFAKIPYKVLMKYKGVLPNKPKNVETAEWLPQRGILAHPNTKVFISHGGKGGTTETLYFGVPNLCMSFYGDQKKNCEDLVEYKAGIHLPYQQMTAENFDKTLDEILNNVKYTENAKRRAALFREQEMNPLDRANFWIDHVYKFNGAKHLQPQSIDMPLYQYLLLDVWAFILSVIAIVIFVLYIIVKIIVKKLCRKSQSIERKVKRN